jgi:hypothetical protein
MKSTCRLSEEVQGGLTILLLRSQCYKTNTDVIYGHFMLNYRSNLNNIEYTLDLQ